MNLALVRFAMAGIVLWSGCARTPTVTNSDNRISPASTAKSDKPKNGFVPDEKTATAIAVAVWVAIYGAEQIEKEKPYKATLTNGIWSVTSTLPQGKSAAMSRADISQEDGCILRVDHPMFTF